MSNDCSLKYPLLMVHGMGFRDRKHLCYWGRVPKRLESLGAEVFFGHQDSVGSVESNADIIAKSLDEILAKTGAEKVNILAHSKGGRLPHESSQVDGEDCRMGHGRLDEDPGRQES